MTAPPPWLAPAPPEACAPAGLAPSAIPVVEGLPSTPCSAAELIALRTGRYVPLFGTGLARRERARAVALVGWAFAPGADPRAQEHALTLVTHPRLGVDALHLAADAVTEGSAPAWVAALGLGTASALGASDAVRAQVARAFEGVATLGAEVALATNTGGELGNWREQYQRLRALDATPAPLRAVSVARRWYDFVLARRWPGLDELRALVAGPALDATSAWLVASAEWVAGDDRARGAMTDLAQGLLAPLARPAPRLVQTVAREMAELLAHPLGLRWAHLRCAAARDHAAASIRQWLHAATEERFFEEAEGGSPEHRDLGPEPSRAGRAAEASRQDAGDFLLDWFVPERDARASVDDWARRAMRVYHRLRGAALLDVALRGAAAEGLSLDEGRLVEGPAA